MPIQPLDPEEPNFLQAVVDKLNEVIECINSIQTAGTGRFLVWGSTTDTLDPKPTDSEEVTDE